MVAVHKAPLFFCAPGGPKSAFNNDDRNGPAPWPALSCIRIKVLPGEKTFDVILNVIKATSGEWERSLGGGFTTQWVGENEPAEVRVSFRNDEPNWSCIGKKATEYDQSKATMNFCFGDWQGSKAVYSHAHIARMAAHLFGHAFGLPHPPKSWAPWNQAELSKLCGPQFAGVAMAEKGWSDLQSPRSIMHFDRPAILGSDADILQGGMQIDDESRAALKKLYPSMFSAFLIELKARSMSEFRRRDGSNWGLPGKQTIQTSCTGNAVAGLTRLDMNNDRAFRAKAEITCTPGTSLTVSLGTWGDTDLYDANCNVLAFNEGETRIQTGRVRYYDITGTYDNPSEKKLQHPVKFKKSFAKTPKVVTFISHLDTKEHRRIRAFVFPTEINADGFNLNMDTGWNSTIHDLVVTWLAHDPDEGVIRTGVWNDPVWTTKFIEARTWTNFDTPFLRKPRFVFSAMCHIDIVNTEWVRVECSVPNWDHQKVESRYASWDVSKIVEIKTCYIAIL